MLAFTGRDQTVINKAADKVILSAEVVITKSEDQPYWVIALAPRTNEKGRRPE